MANQNTTCTLRQVLGLQKPIVDCITTARRNTNSEKWPTLKPRDPVTIWDDFNLINLNESYGHILDFAVPEQLLAAPGPDQALAGVVIKEPEDVNHLISWNDGLMKPTLQFAKSHLGLHPGIVLCQSYSTADKSAFASIPNAPGPKRQGVDHIIALDDFPGSNLVVGLGRPSSKWSGRKLANQLDAPTKELLWPLRQLANLCNIAQTRYGYVQTDKELVVCCFSTSKSDEYWNVSIMPIPWSRSGVDVLTTDLALWWLCMLAMSAGPEHRAIVVEGEMGRINDWDVRLDEEHGWVRRHRYSRVEEATSPPPPPDYRTPSPGNAAAFAAGVGLHANDWFDMDGGHVDAQDLAGLDAAGLDVPNAGAGFEAPGLVDFGLQDLHPT